MFAQQKYAAFGAGDSTLLRVLVQEARSPSDADAPASSGDEGDPDGTQVWRLTAVHLDTVRPEWRAAQASFSTSSAKKDILEGKANNGGFAVDDLNFIPGECPTRPAEAGSKN